MFFSSFYIITTAVFACSLFFDWAFRFWQLRRLSTLFKADSVKWGTRTLFPLGIFPLVLGNGMSGCVKDDNEME